MRAVAVAARPAERGPGARGKPVMAPQERVQARHWALSQEARLLGSTC